jgi:hypothetical protein
LTLFLLLAGLANLLLLAVESPVLILVEELEGYAPLISLILFLLGAGARFKLIVYGYLLVNGLELNPKSSSGSSSESSLLFFY